MPLESSDRACVQFSEFFQPLKGCRAWAGSALRQFASPCPLLPQQTIKNIVSVPLYRVQRLVELPPRLVNKAALQHRVSSMTEVSPLSAMATKEKETSKGGVDLFSNYKTLEMRNLLPSQQPEAFPSANNSIPSPSPKHISTPSSPPHLQFHRKISIFFSTYTIPMSQSSDFPSL